MTVSAWTPGGAEADDVGIGEGAVIADVDDVTPRDSRSVVLTRICRIWPGV
jgi:hypothetical protein